MASSCVDRRDQTYINKSLIGDGPTIRADGSYTVNQVDVFAQQLLDNIVAESDNNPITQAVNKYGENFYTAAAYVNGELRNYDASNYPSLSNRWDRGNISNIEVADFIKAFNYTPTGITNQVPDKLLGDLEKYYNGGIYDSLLGGFCDSMDNLFNQIDAFYDLIGVVDGIIQDAAALYRKFLALKGKYEGQTPLEIIEEEIVKALMKEIKEKIVDSIIKIYEKIEDAIENFDVVGEIGDLVTAIDKKHTKYIMTRKERMCNELTDEAKKNVQDRVKGFMDYAFGLFENMDLATMQFLVARFCALAANIEGLVNDIKNPLDDYGNRYQRVIKRLQAIGNQNTSTAIRNGAIRFSPEQRQSDINTLNSIWEGEGQTIPGYEKIDVAEITAQEYKDLPKCKAVMDGTDLKFKVDKTYYPPDNDKKVFDEKEGVGIAAYTHLDLDVKVYLARLQAIYGNTMEITNGWISQDYNQTVLKRDNDNPHLSGLVIDIKVDDAFKSAYDSLETARLLAEQGGIEGPTETAEDWVELFINNAKKSGFLGVVVYNNHIHLDIREIPR